LSTDLLFKMRHVRLPKGSGLAKAILWLLADHTRHKGCWPSIKLLQEESGFGRQTVLRSLAKLEKWGVISVKHRKGAHLSNYYSVNLDPFIPADQADQDGTAAEEPEDQGGTAEQYLPGTANSTSGDRNSTYEAPEANRSFYKAKLSAKPPLSAPAVAEAKAREAADLLELAKRVASWRPEELVAEVGGKDALKDLAAWFGMPARDIKRRLRENDDRNFAYWVYVQASVFLRKHSPEPEGVGEPNALPIAKEDSKPQPDSGTPAPGLYTAEEALHILVSNGVISQETADEARLLPEEELARRLQDVVEYIKSTNQD
jgi:hypothetical protein